MENQNQKYVTVRQAAVLKGVPIMTLHFWIRKGQLPATKWGRDYQIDRETLLAFTPPPVGRPFGWRKNKTAMI